jgi:hypothetical protein
VYWTVWTPDQTVAEHEGVDAVLDLNREQDAAQEAISR